MLTELRQQMTASLDAAKAIQATAETDDRDISADELGAIQGHLDRVETIKAQVETVERLDDAAATVTAPRTPATVQDTVTAVGDTAQELSGNIQTHDCRADNPTHEFHHMGDFASAVASAAQPGTMADERLSFFAAAGDASGMNQTVGADGGFGVPPSFANAIWDGLNALGDNLLARTDQLTVTGESISIPANAETSRAAGSRYGGVRGYWISEAEAITASTPKLRMVKVEPQQLAVLVYATNKLLSNNTVALDQYITRAAVEEINFMSGDAIVNGSGAGQPLGLLNSGSLVTVAKESGQAADTLLAANIDKMWSRLHPNSRANAVWLVNVDCEPQLQALVQDSNGGVPLFRPANGLIGQQLDTLKNRPLIPVEFCPTIGDAGDIILADLSAYVSGVRGGIEQAMSVHLKFDSAQSAFRFIFEVDGQPYLNSALTPFKGSNTLSTHINLAARA